jgi:hypothetical protein
MTFSILCRSFYNRQKKDEEMVNELWDGWRVMVTLETRYFNSTKLVPNILTGRIANLIHSFPSLYRPKEKSCSPETPIY